MKVSVPHTGVVGSGRVSTISKYGRYGRLFLKLKNDIIYQLIHKVRMMTFACGDR